jgi:hypothetical protein
MAYLTLDSTCSALMEQLREADRQRDHLRAGLSDAAMYVELNEVERNLPWRLMEPEERAQLKAEREAAIRARIEKRAARRAKEMERFGSYTRPGTWDADLDNYQEPRYEEDVGDGYSVRLVRTRDLTWNGYVILPAGHCAAERHYDFFSGYESPAGLPTPPQELTHSTMGEYRAVFGFYLSYTVRPRPGALFSEEDYSSHNFYSLEKTGYSPLADNGSVYVDYARMREKCVELVGYFKGLTTDPKLAAICRSAKRCPKHRCFYVGVCEGCSPPPPKPVVKKSWAAIAAGK